MEVLQHCFNYAQQYYGDLLLDAESNLADELFDLAEKSISNEEQRRYFEALQQLKKHSTVMHETFKAQIYEYFESFIRGTEKQNPLEEIINSASLSLVDRDVLEDELAISVIVSKSNSHNSESLWKLNRRLAVLRGGKNVSDENNPFGPAKICNAIQAAVSELELDNKTRTIVYKSLGKILVSKFAPVLESLNTTLVDQKILPNLQFQLTERSTNGQSQQITRQHATTESALSIAHQHELFNAISSLQSNNGLRSQTFNGVSFSGIATGNNDDPAVFSPLDYALALSVVQQSKALLALEQVNKPAGIAQIEESLFKQLAKQSNQSDKKIAQSHANTVDLVGLIFRYMLDDQNLHDAVKSLLSHLHTPYLKLALIDPSFLDNHEHSARVLLNLMAEVGSRWVSEADDRRVLPVIKKNVETILKDFIDDISIFDLLLEEFAFFKDNLEKRAMMVEKRNTESLQGLERLELSKQRALQEIDTRLQKENLPENICHLLQKPWANFLAFNLLRHGEHSSFWKSTLTVVDEAFLSIRPSKTLSSIDEIKSHQLKISQSITARLELIGYDQLACKELLASLYDSYKLIELEPKNIQKTETTDSENTETSVDVRPTIPPNITDADSDLTHTNVNTTSSSVAATQVRQSPANANTEINKPSNDVKAAPASFSPPNIHKDVATNKNTKNNSETPPRKRRLSREQQSILATLKNIAFGTWFEFKQNKATVSLKLAWYSQITSNYMFVDQTGMKQTIENQLDLVKGISEGRVAIISLSQKSFMERALESVLDTLNSIN